ncbi:hypothetical protein AVEN_18819-1 [Araneus ventricosus]|uniref:Uncharacterized protein n=1 Tax=Araneus ventricosus TaxID=182803 RepID=A0A4Y2SQC2_ARAVE|nr:hypothetical protein AVEN_18819-1 [Araneus ventricosus]
MSVLTITRILKATYQVGMKSPTRDIKDLERNIACCDCCKQDIGDGSTFGKHLFGAKDCYSIFGDIERKDYLVYLRNLPFAGKPYFLVFPYEYQRNHLDLIKVHYIKPSSLLFQTEILRVESSC